MALGEARRGSGLDIDPTQRLRIPPGFEKLSTPEALGKVPLRGTGGKLRLTDVAKVAEARQPLIGDAVVNGRDAMMLVVEKLTAPAVPAIWEAGARRIAGTGLGAHARNARRRDCLGPARAPDETAAYATRPTASRPWPKPLSVPGSSAQTARASSCGERPRSARTSS